MALKDFLLRDLRALSDADPDVLADYILALLKHDRPNMEEWLVSQLADFLHANAKPFVQRLLRHVLTSNESITSNDISRVPIVEPRQRPVEERVESRPRNDSIDENEDRRSRYDSRRRSRSPRRDRQSDRNNSRSRQDRPDRDRERPKRIMKNNNHETRLIVDRIPNQYCTIDAVTDYFKRFGRLVQVTITDPREGKAVIEFEGKEEAQRALLCPDAMFGNRFVRLYPDQREGHQVVEQPRPTLPKVTTYTAPNYVPPPRPSLNPPAVAPSNTRLLELNKQKQDLLNAYLEQQRLLLQKLESVDEPAMDDDTKQTIMAGLKSVDEKIASISIKPLPESTASAQSQTQPQINVSRKLDLRTTTICIAPVPEKLADGNVDMATLLFGTFGQVKAVEFAEEGLLVTFGNRQDAEKVHDSNSNNINIVGGKVVAKGKSRGHQCVLA